MSNDKMKALFLKLEEQRLANIQKYAGKLRCVCGNCGKIEFFDSFEEAFNAGWDTVDRFGYTACEVCPGVAVYFPMLYAQQARHVETEEERGELLQKAMEASVAFHEVEVKPDE